MDPGGVYPVLTLKKKPGPDRQEKSNPDSILEKHLDPTGSGWSLSGSDLLEKPGSDRQEKSDPDSILEKHLEPTVSGWS